MLIGICGKAGAGKDSVADQIQRTGTFVRHSLAGPIKQMLDVIGVNCNSRENKEKPHPIFGVSPRRMAQTLGTEWMRDLIDKDGWLKIAQDKWRQYYINDVGMVVPDVRFENEVDWIRKEGILLHVIRPNVGEVSAHSSENGIEYGPNDIVIRNGGTIEELNETTNKVINAIKTRK